MTYTASDIELLSQPPTWNPPSAQSHGDTFVENLRVAYGSWESGKSNAVSGILSFFNVKSANDARDLLIDHLLEWSDNDRGSISQSHFWRFYDDLCIAEHLSTHLQSNWFKPDPSEMCVRLVASNDSRSFNVENRHPLKIPFAAPRPRLVVDGQHRFTASTSNDKWDLSRRSIRWIAKRVLAEIQHVELSSVASILSLARDTLKREINARVRLRRTSRSILPTPSWPQLTRESILSFRLNTGNPPPLDCLLIRTGTVRTPVTFGTASQRLENDTFRRRYYRGDLLHAIRSGHRAARVSQSAQDCTSIDSRPQPTRCRRFRTDLSMAEFRRKARCVRRWKMAPYIRVDGRRRSVFNPTGATMNLRRMFQ